MKILINQGIKFSLGCSVERASLISSVVKLNLKDQLSLKEESLEADVVLVAVGRSPNTENLGLKLKASIY